MVRSVDAIEGLAALGSARVGPMVVPVPSLLVPEGYAPPEGIPTQPVAHRVAGRSGLRRVVLGAPESALSLEFPIPTPDLEADGGSIVQVDGTTAFIRGPVSETDLAPLRSSPPPLVVLTNARALLREGRPFIEAIGAIRRSLGPAPILWAPRVSTPNRIPLLLYLGIDLFDATESLAEAAEGVVADPELSRVEGGGSEFCGLPGCEIEGGRVPPAHPLHLLARELRRASASVRQGRLRQLVEGRSASEPLLAELLRYADRDLYDLLESRTPVVESGIRPYVLKESFRRPSARRFRERFVDRYVPPPSKAILLLVPCSKTKPYRNSRSHRRFASAWEGLEGTDRIHVVSVTSPLGVVPRELEDVPPARHYDIPVTGDWDEGEREAVLQGIGSLVAKGAYRSVVAHLDPVEYGFLRQGLEGSLPIHWTLTDGRTTATPALQSLRATLQRELEGAPRSGGALRTVREELRGLAAFQFGPTAAASLFQEPVRLHGRPWFQRLSDGAGTDLATWREERGLFHLTVGGAERIGPEGGIAVEAAPGVALTGDLFDPGVVRADRSIRLGDAVSVWRAGELLGVGEARLPGEWMGRLGRGLAVAVRHRRGTPSKADSAIEPTGVAPAGRSSSG